jgi:hypothetical protein
MENAKLKMMVEIEKQRSQINEQNSTIHLVRPCLIDDGILRMSDLMRHSSTFDIHSLQVGFFIPASGSGSRMFAFLEKFLSSGVEDDICSLFFRKLNTFAFAEQLHVDNPSLLSLKEKISIARRLLYEEPYAYSEIPKGLIPFFKIEERVETPFALHLKQAKSLLKNDPFIHFTVQNKYALNIRTHLAEKFPMDIRNVSFSSQDATTDSFCFDKKLELIYKDGVPLRRPSGHGALLPNLNAVEMDYLLIKNIDNIQVNGAAEISLTAWRDMLDVLVQFKKELYQICRKMDSHAVKELNLRYQFMDSISDVEDEQLFTELLNRPIRICGMVKNEGKPGGGPFWVDVNGTISKQIVELSQISDDPIQLKITEESTHFNPVFMICSMLNANDERIDLANFVNDELYLKVTKSEGGEEIRFRELPGLWNGSMHYWTTLFVELPGTVFTPVKTAVDLI